ncbi:MAG: hypothetical protein Q8K18_10640 [Burkholderiales bacterium]|nr:hypothetical protein [Burkholderiales bacterium]
MQVHAAVRWYEWFKALVFALIALNALIFLIYGTKPEAIDTLAWLTLLVLFELETAHPRLLQGGQILRMVHLARLAAGAAICVAALGYVNDKAWLDAVNLGLWIGVVILLEFEVRYPQAVVRSRTSLGATAVLLYSGLAVMVGAWAWHGEWFDAYDALLWLIAFLAIEMDVLRMPTTATSAPRSKRSNR